MSDIILKVEDLSKQYRLGQIGTGTISHDLNRFWHKLRGKNDPFLEVGRENDRSSNQNDGYVWALKDVSFELRQGEVLGVIGKNGAGKSTLLKILSRITAPTKGSVYVKGRIASLLEVGTGFHPELTGLENIYLNGAILGMNKFEIKARLDEIVEFSGCSAYLDTPVKRYSSGMIVRLGFAVAAHLESEILVVDEVLAVGDQEFQNKCIGKMKDVSTSGRTILFVSHNMQSVQNLCQNGILMQNGTSTFMGPVKETINKYLKSGDSQNHHSLDLTKVTEREGTGEIKFERIEIFTNGSASNTLVIGDNLKFKIQFKSKSKARFKMALHLYRFDETLISNIENGDSLFHFESFEGTQSIEVDFGAIMLYPDIYKVGLWVGDIMSEENFDFIKFCCQFEVVDGSEIVHRTISKNSGLIYYQPQWKRTEV